MAVVIESPIKTSRAVHNFACKIVNEMSKKLLARGYDANTLQSKLDAKIKNMTFVNIIKRAFEANLTIEQAADNFIKILQL